MLVLGERRPDSAGWFKPHQPGSKTSNGLCLDVISLVELVFMFRTQSASKICMLVLQELAKHKILSAPIIIAPGLEDVLDAPSQEVANEALVGWLDIKDILEYLLKCKSGTCYF
jgi:hypothetical protein